MARSSGEGPAEGEDGGRPARAMYDGEGRADRGGGRRCMSAGRLRAVGRVAVSGSQAGRLAGWGAGNYVRAARARVGRGGLRRSGGRLGCWLL